MPKINAVFALLLISALVPPLSLFAVPAYPAFAIDGSNVYVNSIAGNDLNDGLSPVTASGHGPKQTITSAISVVSTGGTVHVAAGTYYEHDIAITTSFDLVGAGARQTVIDAAGVGRVLRTDKDSVPQINTVTGFTLRNGHVRWGTPGGGMPVGGALYVALWHVMTLNDCTIKDSIADFMGGGVYSAGQTALNRCTLSGNYASQVGGAVVNYKDVPREPVEGPIAMTNGTMYLTNCTIFGNSAGTTGGTVVTYCLGGGVYNGGDISFLNVTIAGNSLATHPDPRGGGFAMIPLQCVNDEGTPLFTPVATFQNTIVANNSPTNGYNYYGEVTSVGGNLDSQDTCEFSQPTDQTNTDPLLGPLQNNGGPTDTCAITVSSPAYMHGNRSAAPDTDQRGIPRPTGALCSVGAFEPGVVTGAVNTDSGRVIFRVSDGYLARLTGFSGGDLPCTAGNFNFPYGMFSFRITNLAPGQTVRVTIHLPVPLPPNAGYFKCENGVAIDYTDLISRPDDNTIVLTLTDGGRGDLDKIANGTVVDPGGPAVTRKGAVTHGASLPATPQVPVSLPRISVRSASLSANRVAPGSPVTVTADVANTGAVNGTIRVTPHVNGQQEQGKGVTVISGSTVPVTFTVSRNEPGTYSVYVGGVQAGSFVVDQPVDPDLVLFISAALVLLAVVLGVFVLRPRQQR